MIEPTVKLFESIELKRRELAHIGDAGTAERSARAAAEQIRDDLDNADLLIQERRFPELYGGGGRYSGDVGSVGGGRAAGDDPDGRRGIVTDAIRRQEGAANGQSGKYHLCG